MSGAAQPWRFYRLFGLVLRTAFALPELEAISVAPTATPDVDIVTGDIAAPRDPVTHLGAAVSHQPDGLIIEFRGIARFRVRGGREITVCAAAHAAQRDVNVFLLGTAVGALLHQRGVLPLHANAVEVDGRAFAFAGDSGAGKSTLAVRLQDLGFPLLSDDICAIDFEAGGRPVAWPGIPRAKLWGDALQALGRTALGLEPVGSTPGKFQSPLHAFAAAGPYPLAAIYHLKTAGETGALRIHRLAGLAAVNVVTANTYRRRLAELDGLAPDYLRRALQVASATPIFAIDRAWGFGRFERECDEIRSHVRHLARQV